MQEDQFIKNLLKRSEMQVTADDFTDKVMQQAHQIAAHRNQVNAPVINQTFIRVFMLSFITLSFAMLITVLFTAYNATLGTWWAIAMKYGRSWHFFNSDNMQLGIIMIVSFWILLLSDFFIKNISIKRQAR